MVYINCLCAWVGYRQIERKFEIELNLYSRISFRSIEIHLEIYNMIQNKTSESEINLVKMSSEYIEMICSLYFTFQFLAKNLERRASTLYGSYVEVESLSPRVTGCHFEHSCSFKISFSFCTQKGTLFLPFINSTQYCLSMVKCHTKITSLEKLLKIKEIIFNLK